MWLGPLGSLGDTPSPTGGLGLGGELRVSERVALGLEATGTLPSAVRVGTGGRGRAEAFVTSLAALGCVHVSLVFGCARGSVGLLVAAGSDVSAPSDGASPVAAAGLRLGARLPLGRLVFVGLHLDGDVPLVRVALRVDDRELWQTAPLVGRLSVVVGAALR